MMPASRLILSLTLVSACAAEPRPPSPAELAIEAVGRHIDLMPPATYLFGAELRVPPRMGTPEEFTADTVWLMLGDTAFAEPARPCSQGSWLYDPARRPGTCWGAFAVLPDRAYSRLQPTPNERGEMSLQRIEARVRVRLTDARGRAYLLTSVPVHFSISH